MTFKTGHRESGQQTRERETSGMNRATLEKLFELSLDMLCVADFDGYFRLINSAFEKILGHPRDALLGHPYIELVHPEDKPATLAAMDQLVAGEPVACFENRYLCQDGTYKWIGWTSMPAPAENLTYAVGRDISKQKAILKELTGQRDLLDNVLSNVPASIFWKDRNSVFLGANDRFLHDTGLQSVRDIIGKTDYDLTWNREESDFYRECDRRVMETGIPMLDIEESQQRTDGETAQLLTSKVPLRDAEGQTTGMLGIYMDITQRKQAEVALAKSESRLKTLFNSAAEFIFVINPEGLIIGTNSHACKHSGYAEDEIVGRNIKEFFTEGSQHTCDCNFPGLRETGHNRAEIEFVCKDGRVIDMECSATAVPDENGNFSTFLIIQRDVTERKRNESALANSEHRFRAIFNSAFQLIGVLDPDGVLLDANQTALDFVGLDKEEVVGVPFWDIYCWNYSGDVQSRLKAAIAKASQGIPVSYEDRLLGKNGAIRTIGVTLKPVMNQQGEVAFIIPEGRDISDQIQAEQERQRHQEQLAHVMRLSTMGEMASGMAHELNQPLTALISYCGTALDMTEKIPSLPEGYIDILRRATAQAHRAGDVIRHLREFIGKSNNARTRVVLDDLVQGVLDFISSELRDSGIKLTSLPGPDTREVLVDKIQIEQVIINLIRNSIEAIRQAGMTDGRIEIETRLQSGNAVELSITDNGPGVDPAIADLLFEPYQTSKPSGMGMGLSISRSIIEAHYGSLWSDADMTGGARFSISLPVAE